jgi:DNA polymerase-1
MRPNTLEAYRLLHQGCLVLSQIESNGFRVDTDHLEGSIAEATEKIEALERRLLKSKEYKVWTKVYGPKAKLGNREQLGRVFFKELGFLCKERTETGRYKADEKAFEGLDNQFIQDYFKVEKLKKARSTYLQGIKREVVDGYLHPVFNLHTAVTYRSSSDSPNFQNFPIRYPEIGEMVRRCFVPRKGRHIVEVDFKAIEVCIAACYCKDPSLVRYIKDPKSDMHEDAAAMVYMLTKDQVSKQVRFYAKNQFVFPQFYGSYFRQCAPALWETIHLHGLKVKDSDVSLYKHLKSKGITKLGACDPDEEPERGTFEYHVKKMEEKFWGEMFPVYAKWKKKWWASYLEKGYFDFYTGFRVEGEYKKNEVLNSSIQGSAFHCLLWSLVQIQKEIRRHRMKTLLVGQIHDSLEADVPPDELDDFVGICQDVMTRRLPKHWSWITVPLRSRLRSPP